MVNQSRISGEVEHDIGLLKGEIRRAARVFNDEKKRGIDLETKAQDASKALDEGYRSLGQKKLEWPQFCASVVMQLNAIKQGLNGLVIEDAVFVQEVERAKNIMEQFKRVFPFGGENILHISTAEAHINMAEIYLEARLKGCQSFIKNTLDPLAVGFGISGFDQRTWALKMKRTYHSAYDFAKEINEATRQVMISILQFYKQLYKKYPLLEKVLAGEAWSQQTNKRYRVPA